MGAGLVLFNGVATALAGVVFLDAGIRIARRRVWAGDRRAVMAFGAWWILYGCLGLLRGVRLTTTAADFRDMGWFLTIFYAENLAAFLGLSWLLVYIVYLWKATYLRWWVHLVAGALAVAVNVAVQSFDPQAILIEGARLDVAFGTPMPDGLRWSLVGLYYVPLVIIAALFLHLARINRGASRLRALGVGVVLAMLAIADAIELGPNSTGNFTAVAPVLRLLAAAAVLAAYLRE